MAEKSGIRKRFFERTNNDDAPHAGGSDLDYLDAESEKFKYEKFKCLPQLRSSATTSKCCFDG